MIKRAKRLALDLFKDLKDSYHKHNKKTREKRSSVVSEGAPNDRSSPVPSLSQSSPSLLRRSSERYLSSKRKSKKKAKNYSLPLPLNSDPDWAEMMRKRSSTEPYDSPRGRNGESITSPRGRRKPERTHSQMLRLKGKEQLVVVAKYEVYAESQVEITLETDAETAFIAERLADPIHNEIVKAIKADKEELSPSLSPALTAHTRDDRSEHRKATSLDAEKVKVTIEEYNNEIVAMWDIMAAREIDEVTARLDAEKQELLAEIALREFPSPCPAVRDKMKRRSTVMFNNTVIVRELDGDGVARTTSTAELFDQHRPRPISRKIRRPSRPSPLQVSSTDKVLDPPECTDTSSVDNPPVIPPRSDSPVTSSQSPPPSPVASSPTASPSSSPSPSPCPSPTPLSRSPSPSPSSSPSSSPTTQSRWPIHAWKRLRASKEYSKAPKPEHHDSDTNFKFDQQLAETEIRELGEEEEINRANLKFDRQKLELLEEIEIREIREAMARHDAERSAIVAEITRRETIHRLVVHEKRRAVRFRQTMMRGAGIQQQSQDQAQGQAKPKESQEVEIEKEINGMGLGGQFKWRPRTMRRRSSIWRKNGSLRAARATLRRQAAMNAIMQAQAGT